MRAFLSLQFPSDTIVAVAVDVAVCQICAPCGRLPFGSDNMLILFQAVTRMGELTEKIAMFNLYIAHSTAIGLALSINLYREHLQT